MLMQKKAKKHSTVSVPDYQNHQSDDLLLISLSTHTSPPQKKNNPTSLH
jgi:hypothetical protein